MTRKQWDDINEALNIGERYFNEDHPGMIKKYERIWKDASDAMNELEKKIEDEDMSDKKTPHTCPEGKAMKEVWFEIDGWEDREKMVVALANSGFRVVVFEKKDKIIGNTVAFNVVVDVPDDCIKDAPYVK